MAPIVLKVKGSNQLLPFNNLDSDDLSKTWRVCTKVKDSLENGSRLENLSWRLWFSHNVNNTASAKTKKPACKAASPVLRNFKVPDDFDFQSQKKSPTPKNKVGGKQVKRNATTLQSKKKQPTQKLQINTNMDTDTDTDNSFAVQGNYHQQQQQHQHHHQHHQQQQQQHYHHEVHQQQKPQQEHYHQHQHYSTNQQQQIDLDTRNGNIREEFTLHQYTSDQAGDQVVELEDIFGSFGEIQAYIESSGNIVSSATTPTIANNNGNTVVAAVTSDTNGATNEQQANTLINTNGWDISQQDPLYQQQQQPYYSSQQQQPIQSNATTPIHVSFDDANTANYNASQYYNYPYYDDNRPVDVNNLNSALYVSSDTMPPIPIGTLHNKLLATLPRETLESAEKLFTCEDHNTQSTPTTPYTTPVYHHYEPEPMEKDDPFEFMMLQYARPQQPNGSSFQSKSLPPSRATSPPPTSSSSSTPKRNMNGSASDGKAAVCSNCSTTSTPLWRRSANDELLCNACGLYLKLHNAPRPKYLKPQSVKKDAPEENTTQPLCSNCGTSTTPLWRRDIDGSPLCNACGLYLKLHHEKRPLSMKTDSIKKRQRCDHGSANPISKNNTDCPKQKSYFHHNDIYTVNIISFEYKDVIFKLMN
ncbi:hypothetical protein K501DRAFT_333383 [Backusella circina FSU 941]|nr:hypothetical protein K501DRAFT_333383 [Backusella circina FSU 941]